MNGRRATRSYGSYAFTAGAAFIAAAMPIILLLEYGTMIGASFAGDDLMTSLTYWTWIVSVSFPILPYIMAVLALGLGKIGLATGGLVLYGIAIAWQIFVVVYGVIIFADCEGDIHCADNLSYIGAITGPYGGPSIRYIILFSATLAMLVFEVIALGVLFAGRRMLVGVRMGEVVSHGSGLWRQGVARPIVARVPEEDTGDGDSSGDDVPAVRTRNQARTTVSQ